MQIAQHWLLRKVPSGRPTPTFGTGLAGSLFRVGGVSFHPVLDCVVFSLTTLIAKYKGPGVFGVLSWD